MSEIPRDVIPFPDFAEVRLGRYAWKDVIAVHFGVAVRILDPEFLHAIKRYSQIGHRQTIASNAGVHPAMPIGIDFAKKLQALGIKDFRMLVEAHHARVVTSEEFRRALALSDFRGY